MTTQTDSPLGAPVEAPDKGVVCDALVSPLRLRRRLFQLYYRMLYAESDRIMNRAWNRYINRQQKGHK